jgi:hypothetical protein
MRERKTCSVSREKEIYVKKREEEGCQQANRQALNWIANLTWERGGQRLEG